MYRTENRSNESNIDSNVIDISVNHFRPSSGEEDKNVKSLRQRRQTNFNRKAHLMAQVS